MHVPQIQIILWLILPHQLLPTLKFRSLNHSRVGWDSARRGGLNMLEMRAVPPHTNAQFAQNTWSTWPGVFSITSTWTGVRCVSWEFHVRFPWFELLRSCLDDDITFPWHWKITSTLHDYINYSSLPLLQWTQKLTWLPPTASSPEVCSPVLP